MPEPKSARPRWLQPVVILAAVGLVVFAGVESLGSLQQTQWLQAVPATTWGRSELALAPVASVPSVARAPEESTPDGSESRARVSTRPNVEAPPFACVAPVPANKTLAVMVARYKHPQSGLMFVTFTNKDRLDFGLTWAYRLCLLGLPHFAIGALDQATLEAGNAAGVPMFAMGEHNLGVKDYGWNTPRFKLMGQDKVQLLIDILSLDATAVLMDADAILVHDPTPFFASYPEAELLVPTDFTSYGAMDGGLEEVRVSEHVMNIGLMYAKPSALSFARHWREYLRLHPDRWDQTVFNEQVKRDNATLFNRRLWRTQSAKFERIVVGVLPIAIFCSGHTWSVSKLPERSRLAPLLYHTAMVFSLGIGKRHRMREHKIWFDQPAYYEPEASEVGFLTLDAAEPPDELVRAPTGGNSDGSGMGNYTLGWHFKLVHWQLARVRDGLLLARELRRRFVLPRLMCGFDRWWASHKGVIPNSATLLPIRECPADHLLNLELIPERLMPKEYSFLENERREVPYPNYASATAVLAELSTPELAAVRVLTVANIGPVFETLMRSDDEQLFERAKRFALEVQRWADQWCCAHVPPGVPGQILYDMFADIEGHRDRFGRVRTGEWEPFFGSSSVRLRDCTYSGLRNQSVVCNQSRAFRK